jgi:hypothetical protein
MFLGWVSTRETWKNRKIMERGKVLGRLASEEFCPGIARCMWQCPVEIRSREEPNTKFGTDRVASLEVCRDTLIASGKKSKQIHLIGTWGEERIGTTFFTEDDNV